MSFFRRTTAAVLLHLVVLVSGHGHDGGMNGMDMDGSHEQEQPSGGNVAQKDVVNYADLSAHSGLMMAHIGLMVLAWFFILPLGKFSAQHRQ